MNRKNFTKITQQGESVAAVEFGRLLLDLGKIVFAGAVVGEIFVAKADGIVYSVISAVLFCGIGYVLVVFKKGAKK